MFPQMHLFSGLVLTVIQILSLSVVLLWITVATRTMRMAITGDMFQAPCLKDLREKSQAAGSDRRV